MFDFLEILPFPVIVTDHTGVIESYNQSFCRLAKNRPVQGDIKTLFSEWEMYDGNLVVAKLRNKPYLLLPEFFKKEEKAFIVYFVMKGQFIEFFQQKMHELQDLKKLYETIIENSLDVIYITDRDGNTLRVSSNIEKLTGYPKESFIGKNVKDFVRKGKFKESMTLKVLQKGEMVSSVAEIDSLNLKTAIPVINDEGEIYKVVTFVRNLTELNQIYNELNNALKLKNRYKRELDNIKKSDVIVKSKKMKEIFETADRIANVDATVLILGETGVGKDVLANHIYRTSDRNEKGKLIKINCGAIPYHLLESELFGYEAGAFTGAKQSGKPGMFELAHKGVLFLDEVGELPLVLQVKLLRVLQEKQIQRIGSTKPKEIDVRLIAATNRNLKELVGKGEFREDLYYRLNVVPIHIPPLRERKEEILPLVQSLIEKNNEKYHFNKVFDKDLKEFFYNYEWPGNIRELSNLVERLILTIPDNMIKFSDLPEEYQNIRVDSLDLVDQAVKVNDMGIKPLKEAVEEVERYLLANALEKFGSTYKIARELKTSQTTIVRKLKKYNLLVQHHSS
ncbi:Fis family transcriptional regulator [Pueribacillus theae]|uniref:HTH-type transcriptional regulatory protein TyrR n=1 Tax=Pueribacillus theae TaxID=2171751 RepID=A0A2U1K4F8_9BACI|nr:sigma 54-interacting transcriptional regulator [Pueribacillus theae]PWA12282.1 Fis family transcriptional regulator [Pueribacillus theae]